MSTNRHRDEAEAPLLGFAGESRRPVCMRRPHMHHEIELNYLPTGSMTYETASGTVRIASQRLTVFWAATPHRVIHIEKCPRFFWFTLPLQWVLGWSLPDSFIAAILKGRFAEAKADPADDVLVQRWSDDFAAGDEDTLDIALLEIQARLRRMAKSALFNESPHGRRANRVTGKRDAVAAMMAFIAQNYAKPISAQNVAAAVCLNANYASTLIRSRCGTTLSHLISMQRCFAARRLLVSTQRPILDIAYDCGFGSISRFYEAFSQIYGQPPSACRTMRRQASRSK